MKCAFLFALLLLQLSINSQSLNGVVLDSVSNEKLPYANLVLKDKNVGAYSNEDGSYNFDISKATINDTLVISLIGYYNKKMAAFNYINESTYNLNFQMESKVEDLEEVITHLKQKEYSITKKGFQQEIEKLLFHHQICLVEK